MWTGLLEIMLLLALQNTKYILISRIDDFQRSNLLNSQKDQRLEYSKSRTLVGYVWKTGGTPWGKRKLLREKCSLILRWYVWSVCMSCPDAICKLLSLQPKFCNFWRSYEAPALRTELIYVLLEDCQLATSNRFSISMKNNVWKLTTLTWWRRQSVSGADCSSQLTTTSQKHCYRNNSVSGLQVYKNKCLCFSI
jgi:hypothetical protein